jgi:ubiquitin-conjugating enzyme E2 Q
VYNFPFDALSAAEKPRAIVTILDTLPSVVEMKSWLERNTKVGEEASLKGWVNRISPSALGVLRWIIASNRSCIVPVDQLLNPEGSVTTDTRGKIKDGAERRIPGLDDWLQFRFAMGAPDKEQRFVNCVRNAQQRLNLTRKFEPLPLPSIKEMWVLISSKTRHYSLSMVLRYATGIR